jgi:hypothetical protein
MKKLFGLSHKRINTMGFGTELRYKLLNIADDYCIPKSILVLIKELEDENDQLQKM